MFYAIIWIFVVSLLAVWSLAAWAVQVLGVWAVSHAGGLSGAASSAEGLRMPEWIAPWVPPEMAQSLATWLADLAPLVDRLVQGLPALAGGVSVGVWALWAIGAVLLVGSGGLVHAFIAMWRRKPGEGRPPVGRAIPAD